LTVGQKSGMNHHFSLIAKKQVSGQEIVIALDHAVSESEVQSSPLILYLYKISEVKVDIPIFVAIPVLSETAKKIAQGNNVLLIEGSTEQTEIINKIKNEIENRINQINEKTINESKNQQTESKPETPSFLNKLWGVKKKNAS
jgi:pyridoxal biosynthesis lyase PdxS